MTADKIPQPCCLEKITFPFMFNWQAILTVAIAREMGKPPDFEEMIGSLGIEQRLLDGQYPCPLGWGIPVSASVSSAGGWLPSWFCVKYHHQKQTKQSWWCAFPLFFLSLWNSGVQKILSPFYRHQINSSKRGRKTLLSVSKGFLVNSTWLGEVKCNYGNIINAIKTLTWNYV